MRQFFNLLSCDFKRTLFSFRFLAAVLGFTLVTLITMFDEITFFRPGDTSLVYIDAIIRYLDFHIVYLIFAAIPGTLLFCADWDNRFIRFSVVRCSKRKYAASKAIACFCSAVCVVILSEALTLLLFCPYFPLFQEDSSISLGIYSAFDSADRVVWYFMVEIFYEAFCAGFLCVLALWISTIVINVFVALSTPLLAFYIINTFSFYCKVPAPFHIGYLSGGNVLINDNPWQSFFYTLFIFSVAALVFGALFVKNCVRRIEHG